MRSLGSMGLLLFFLLSSTRGFSAPTITVQIAVYWEGRDLQDPNVEALDRLRKAFPAIPLTHFVNPVYFMNEAKNTANIASLQRVLSEDDEVGLYLAPIEALTKSAGVIQKLSPSFWGYVDEGEICENDCGLDVPLTVYDREDTLRIFAAAHRIMQAAGFKEMQSFAVRGWLEAPFITQLAAAFGYRYDASPIDPNLVSGKLREFPISAWVTQRWSELASADGEALQRFARQDPKVRFVPQRGGVLDLNEQREILARFDRLVKERREHPNGDEAFTLSLSEETAFQSWPKLRMILQGLAERAQKQSFNLRYTTVANVKNSRPVAANMRISTRISQAAEARK